MRTRSMTRALAERTGSTRITRSMARALAEKTGDMLSNLPEVLILYILSFLKARQAVQTCILSKRWRGLWAYIPSIYLDSDEFANQGIIDQEKFICFVNSFFILRKTSQLDSFRLKWFYPGPRPLVARTWIHRVAECKPRAIHIHLSGPDSNVLVHDLLELPQSVFTCNSIEVMTLMLPDDPDKTTIQLRSFFLPCLRSLTLFGIALDDDFVKNLAQGCPVLDEMVMRSCRLEMSDIFSPVLRGLIIDHCEVNTEVCISMPNLVSLKIIMVESGMIWLRNMSSLLKASVSLRSYEHVSEYQESKYELLSGLSNASYITLTESLGFVQMRSIFAKELPKCPKFKNLRSLVLKECVLCEDFNVIAWFVSLAPNLQKLTVRPIENLPSSYEEDEEILLKDEYTSNLEMPQQFECRQLKVEILYQRKQNKGKVQELVNKLRETIKTLKKISARNDVTCVTCIPPFINWFPYNYQW